MAVPRLLLAALAVALALCSSGSANAAPHNATTSRSLATGVGFVAACYAPFHNKAYPLNGGAVDIAALRQAIDDDFRLLSKHVSHVRTYYGQHYGIEVAPIAAKYGLKLYIGAFLTRESWWSSEVAAVANAVNKFPSTVEVVMVGNENMAGWYESAAYILSKVNEVKCAIGANANRVKFGTVQRVTEYLDSRYDSEMNNLAQNLDVLGVNVYPFFSNSYDGSKPLALLDVQWEAVAKKYPRSKLRLTETGFPTAGSPSPFSPRVLPGLTSSVAYYEALVKWAPSGYTGLPKFWFQAFDRPADNKMFSDEYERHFGFFTVARQYKQANFPCVATTQDNFVPGTVAPANNPATTTKAPAASFTTPAVCNVEKGVDYYGNDIKNVKSADAGPCCAFCRATSGCKAYTWSSYNGGTCWLKSGKGTTKGVAGVTSGTV